MDASPPPFSGDAEVVVAGDKHFGVHRAVRIVTGGATFEAGVVLEDKRTFLGGVTRETGLVGAGEVEGAALDRIAAVRVVAIAAAHRAGHHRVAVRQSKLAALLQVALEAGLGRLARIDDRAAGAARLGVDAGRAVTGLAAGVTGLGIAEREPAVGGGVEFGGDLGVALGARVLVGGTGVAVAGLT
jgi:hypothetical protein